MIKKQVDLRIFIEHSKTGKEVDSEDEKQEENHISISDEVKLSPNELREYNNVPVFSEEYNCLKALEQLFGYKIPHKNSTQTRMYEFLALDGHIIELRLTQLSFTSPHPIDEFFDPICDLEFLQVLEWCYTFIKSIPASIGNLLHLRVLNLSNNKISTLPLEISNLSNLQILDLSNNELNTIPPAFQNLTSLEILDLNQNHLNSAGLNSLYFPIYLKWLYLLHNPIESPFPGLDDLHKRTWVCFQILKKVPKLHQSYPFCPEHEKVMLPELHFVNKVKGWLSFYFHCSNKACSHTIEILPSMASLTDDFSRVHVNIPSVPIIDTPKCPPHEIIIIEGKNRWIERCTHCGKTREEIENN